MKPWESPDAGIEIDFVPPEIHKAYIRSTVWKRRRARYYETHERKCGLCGSDQSIELHHHRYDHIGNEPDEDFMPMCMEHHFLLHAFVNTSGCELRHGLTRLREFLGLLDCRGLVICKTVKDGEWDGVYT
jgi:hypothetical protein